MSVVSTGGAARANIPDPLLPRTAAKYNLLVSTGWRKRRKTEKTRSLGETLKINAFIVGF